MFLICSGDKPLIATKTLADAEELVVDLEIDLQCEIFNGLKLRVSNEWAMKIIKGQEWHYTIQKLEVI